MSVEPERLIDVDELARRAGRRLEELGVAQANGQVTARPDIRTLRWYTTVGLLDRPAERRGRRAFYGPHHVAQVVAVKRLQAEGASLTDIATRLAGQSTAALEAVAHDPGTLAQDPATPSTGSDRPATGGAATGGLATDGAAGPSDRGPDAGDASARSVSTTRAAHRPGAGQPTPAPLGAPSGSGDTAAFWSVAPLSRSVGVPGVLAGIALDRTTSVTFAAPRPLTDADVEGLRRAAMPLLDELRRRGLVPVPMHLTELPKDRRS